MKESQIFGLKIILAFIIIVIVLVLLIRNVVKDGKKLEQDDIIIKQFKKRISDITSIEQCDAMLREMDNICLSNDGKKTIKLRPQKKVFYLYISVWNKKELLIKLNKKS